MALMLTEQEVTQVLTMTDTIEALERAFRLFGSGQATNQPRQRVRVPGSILQVMAAGSATLGATGLKMYSIAGGRARFLVQLFDARTGQLTAIIEADKLGQIRTGAASGVATKFLARSDVSTVGIYGTGWQARTQLAAVCAVRNIKRIKAYSRSSERREAFADQMARELGVEVVAVDNPETVARGSDVVITATSGAVPILKGEWLEAGVHLNVMGSNSLIKTETDDDVWRRTDLIVTDERVQSRVEAGDLVAAVEHGVIAWEQVHELGDVVTGRLARANREQITAFKSNGIALEDVAAGLRVVELARQRGLGREVPLFAE
jgi:alanine dehydrogenase